MKIQADTIDRSSLLGLPPSLEALAPQSAPELAPAHDGLPVAPASESAERTDPADALLALDAWDGVPAALRQFSGAYPAEAVHEPGAAADRVVDSIVAALS